MSRNDGPEPFGDDGSGRDGDPRNDLDDDDAPIAESGLGALWQLLIALVAVAALLMVLLGGAAVLARLFR